MNDDADLTGGVWSDGHQAEDVEHLIKESEKKLGGPIDIVINNAGIQHVRRALCAVCRVRWWVCVCVMNVWLLTTGSA